MNVPPGWFSSLAGKENFPVSRLDCRANRALESAFTGGLERLPHNIHVLLEFSERSSQPATA
jgi:hypothetical protein